MKQLVVLLVTLLLFGCGSSEPVAGGGDDFPSMISTAGEQIARVLSGEMNSETPVPQKIYMDMNINSSRRGVKISGDTLWIDTVRVIHQKRVTEKWGFSIRDSGSIYSLNRIIPVSFGYDTVQFIDFDGDGFVYKPSTKPFALRVATRGTYPNSWWYKGSSIDSLFVKRFDVMNSTGTVSWFSPLGDSLAEAGKPVRLTMTHTPDTISFDCTTSGFGEPVKNDLVIAIDYRTFRKNCSIQLKVTLSEPAPYRSPMKKGTFTAQVVRNDTLQQIKGLYTETAIAIVTGKNDTAWFNRNGKALERGSK